MSKEKLYIFDTTLRDGAQTQGVDFSIDDKEKIALALDALGVDYIEGGWPGANHTDTEFFQKKLQLKNQNFYRLLFKEEYKGLPKNEGTYNHHFMYRIIEQIVPRNSVEVAMYGKKKKIRTWVRFK